MDLTVREVLVAIGCLALVLLAGKIVRERVGLFRRLYLPGSVVAGGLALLAGPEVLGGLVRQFVAEDAPFADGLLPAFVVESWSALPDMLISVVFAALFLGKPIPALREIWMRAGPQAVFGQIVAWGQYVVGLLLTLLVLTPLFDIHPLAGALIEIGFEGGHGTAAGMAETFRDLGFEEGADLALGLATVGLVMGVLLGIGLINWAVYRGHISLSAKGGRRPPLKRLEEVPVTEADRADLKREKRLETAPTDPLSLHLGVVGLAIAVGWCLLTGLKILESLLWRTPVLEFMPLFPLAMIGGVIVQIVCDRTGLSFHLSRRLIERISGTALDFTIAAALATLSLRILGENLVPFLLLASAGTAWCFFAALVLAPRLIPPPWFERGIGDFGQSMGVTVTGLLLMGMADPKNRSGAFQSFAYKQFLFEPIVGGGLFTGASILLIARFGPIAILVFCTLIMALWLLFGLRYFGPMVKARRDRVG